ncbi:MULTISPECIES: type VI secretion system baseplate subunit TssF [Photorhabdus]|uniref:Type VI secretion system baseplate subunit TssF n=1 Tax=Photorhabdus kayaii TaxID=230088 RepID=A0ABX0B8E5_9GAMM|nr:MULTISPECIES: type VI secretion system baseplate subunit TssF [Photorhabdus]MCC8374248.1 type VI secretion system baseplate subunit TssF [Photorhabdus bodei]MCC8463172.1 type VI secretion system baseplate subunit TssF [Photorhabdus bodei]MDB6368886.1 type VI secretion system baseplate subunit TssF [Photorhabdus bodei]NDL13368.1 type VI secretion system baseplate subunit TssF [Photorhabdus kayaii]NDL27102.1 type VI secretion system baseplate subunit TssF [Photorhabdus kayaii]
MDDLILRYYEAEMRYLRDAGNEFAKAHPDRAALLNLDSVGTRDPYVERLFEGFAFLMGRLREKLDDDLPELTEGLVSLLWPHYLRTIPSLSIVELGADWAQLKQLKNPAQVNKGFEVLSQPIGPQQTRCRYTTTQAVQLLPLALTDASLKSEPDGRAVIRLRFDCGTQVDWRQVDLSRLPLYLSADSPLACALHRALTLQTQQLYLRLPGQPDRQPFDGGFSPLGFGDEERLWPKGDSAFSGYQLLLEYFTFREKFMFVALCGLEQLTIPDRTPWFELDVVLGESWPHERPFSAAHIRLHCVPVINLFPLESDPLPLSPLKTEYLLRPMRLQDGHTEIYSVDAVVSSKRSDHQSYVPFSSFRHQGGMLRHDAPARYYHTRVKQGPSGLYDTWLILGGEAIDNHEGSREAENLSLTLTGTHGQLPRRALQETLLDTAVSPPLAGLTVRNLREPTLPCYPPNRDRFHWRVLSHLGSNFLSLMDNPEVLRGTLALYDWTDDEMNYRRLAAIVAVKHSLIERFEQGCLQRGVHIEVTLDSNGFTGTGDICLFGEMLSRFFALYTDIHLFNRLTLVSQPTGERLSWQEKHSQCIPG